MNINNILCIFYHITMCTKAMLMSFNELIKWNTHALNYLHALDLWGMLSALEVNSVGKNQHDSAPKLRTVGHIHSRSHSKRHSNTQWQWHLLKAHLHYHNRVSHDGGISNINQTPTTGTMPFHVANWQNVSCKLSVGK